MFWNFKQAAFTYCRYISKKVTAPHQLLSRVDVDVLLGVPLGFNFALLSLYILTKIAVNTMKKLCVTSWIQL